MRTKIKTLNRFAFAGKGTVSGDMALDLLEAMELIKEMRRELEDARTVMEKYEAQLTGELFNAPSLNDILERTKEYA